MSLDRHSDNRHLAGSSLAALSIPRKSWIDIGALLLPSIINMLLLFACQAVFGGAGGLSTLLLAWLGFD